MEFSAIMQGSMEHSAEEGFFIGVVGSPPILGSHRHLALASEGNGLPLNQEVAADS